MYLISAFQQSKPTYQNSSDSEVNHFFTERLKLECVCDYEDAWFEDC